MHPQVADGLIGKTDYYLFQEYNICDGALREGGDQGRLPGDDTWARSRKEE